MASIRRILSPVPQPGTLLNEEASSLASSLSKSSSSLQNCPPKSGLLSSLVNLLDFNAFIFGTFAQRSSRPLDRTKPKGQLWRKAVFHFLVCFMVGVSIGLTPFASMDFSRNLMSKHQTFSFEVMSAVGNFQSYENVKTNKVVPDTEATMFNTTLESAMKELELVGGMADDSLNNESFIVQPDLELHKLLIVVTPTYSRPFQAYYLNRLAQTLKLVPPPLLWIVVEMTSQSVEAADILRRTGTMYRHLVCNKNLTDIKDRSIHQRNVALSHIEGHRLDGIVYFADDDNIYSSLLFEQMREISRFGTWTVAKLTADRSSILQGPVCNGTQVIGWHSHESHERSRRFHAEMSGFAFNSTILWDPKKWHRPTLEPIRQLDTVKDGFQVSTFIEQVVEDESQMEGLPLNCSRIMVWHAYLRSSNYFYPQQWFIRNNVDLLLQLA
ncbi:Glycosyltransferase [Quillaja saponaria]|uniref:Glycosyltransferases n=1 Tax=Quillaja saponaria TaxID=32244 RepID=A0AAD7PKK9_QUISA|nr:Glycosyltransferase [Quillaja saponaria]